MKPLFIYNLKVFSSGEFTTCVTMKFQMVRQFLGLRKLHNRSILNVCEDCAIECNDKIVHQINFATRSDRSSNDQPPRE
jgi:hypothetical protein